MPRPPLKLWVLFWLPVVPAVLAVGTLVMLLLDRPVPFVQGASVAIYYSGGVVTLSRTLVAADVGPSAEIVHEVPGDDGRYRNSVEMGEWKAALPVRSWDRAGLHYESRPRVRYAGPNFTADRVIAYGVNAEYLLGVNCLLMAAAVRWYRGARRAYRRMTAGYCPHCGYDLRASPERCPECGRVAAVVSA